jgi:multiple sugar transport system permease protein
VVTVYIPLALSSSSAVPVLLDGRHDLQAERRALQLRRPQPVLDQQSRPSNIRKLLFETDYPQWLLNTMTIACARRALDLRQRARGLRHHAAALPGAQTVGLLIFLAYLVPPCILFIPLAILVYGMGIYDTNWALILTYPTFLIPFCTWLLMAISAHPYELEECALIDGATRIQILWKITLPLAVPA